MSGLEHYPEELHKLDQEIHRYAAICGVDLAQAHQVAACLNDHHDGWAADKARESLRGLLLLRQRVETTMMSEGLRPPPLNRHSDVMHGG